MKNFLFETNFFFHLEKYSKKSLKKKFKEKFVSFLFLNSEVHEENPLKRKKKKTNVNH